MKNSEEYIPSTEDVPSEGATGSLMTIALSSQYGVCTVPHLPHSRLSPNARNNPIVRNRYVQAAKEEMEAEILVQDLRQSPLWEKAHLDITFSSKDKRRRDLDNLIASCKAWIDGLVGMVIVDDSADRLSLSAHYEINTEGYTKFVIWNMSEMSER